MVAPARAHANVVAQTLRRRWRLAVVRGRSPAQGHRIAACFCGQSCRDARREVDGLDEVVVHDCRRRSVGATSRGNQVEIAIAVRIGHGDGGAVQSYQVRQCFEHEG